MAGRGKIPRTRRNKYAEITPEEGTELCEISPGVTDCNEENVDRIGVHVNGSGLKESPCFSNDGAQFSPDESCGGQCRRSKSDPGTESSLSGWESDLDRSRSTDAGFDEVDMACKRTKQVKKKSIGIAAPVALFQGGRVPPRHGPGISENNNIPLLKYKVKNQVKKSDVPKPEDEYSFSAFDVIIYVVSIGSYLFDVGSDVWVSYLYYTRQHYWWFGLTLTFVIIPAITMTCFSLKWYILDHAQETDYKGKKVSKLRWISRFMFLTLQIAPVLRYIDTVRYGIKSKKVAVEKEKKHWFQLMLYEDTDSALLRLIECFLEAAPQLILQLYVMCRQHQDGTAEGDVLIVIVQSISVTTSLCSLAWALTAYHRALRCSLPDKTNMTLGGMAFYFMWRVFTIAARVTALTMFATRFRLYVFIITTSHWMAMFSWIRFQKTHFCSSSKEEFLFNLVAAVVYIFCYFNLVEGHTRLRYLLYYVIVYMENAGMIMAWYMLTQTYDYWYHVPALIIVLGGFFIGILFQAVYYIHFHPNNKYPKMRIKLWVPCSELSCSYGSSRDPSFDMNIRQPSDNTQSVVPKAAVVVSRSDGLLSTYRTSVVSQDSNPDSVDCKLPLMAATKYQTNYSQSADV